MELNITRNQTLHMDEIKYPAVQKMFSSLNVDLCEKTAMVDFEEINNRFFSCTGFTLELSQEQRISSKLHSEMVTKKMVPFSVVNDHDLFIHVLPTICCHYNFTEVFHKISMMEGSVARAWTFEAMFLHGWLTVVGALDVKKSLEWIEENALAKGVLFSKEKEKASAEIKAVFAECSIILLKQEVILNLEKDGLALAN